MSVEKELNNFGKFLVKQSRANLTRKKKRDRGKLYKSLDYDVKVNKNSFEFSFTMENYGDFIDKGVKGKESSLKAPFSPYKYKDKMPPIKAFDGWVIRKGLAGRNDKGQFISRKSLKFAIARSIYNKGLETTNFYTRPFNLGFKKLPEQLVKAYALEVKDLLKFSRK